MKDFKKLLIGILSAVCVTTSVGAVAAFADTAEEEESVIKYIKNSYTPGAYMYDDGEGDLKYGIPIRGEEKCYQWELVEHDGAYAITNVATGRSIEGTRNGNPHTKMSEITDFTVDNLWKLDPTLYNDEPQFINCANGADICLNVGTLANSYDGPTLDPGYVISGKVVANAGECKWVLFDEEDIKFSSVTLEGFCIGDKAGNYLYADGSDLTFKKASVSDNFIWRIELDSKDANNKLLYNDGVKKYLAVQGGNLVLVDKAQAMPFNMFASLSTTIVGDNNAVLTKSGSALTVGSNKNSNDAKFSIELAVNVAGVLGDLKLNGTYAFNNCWSYMYMINDGGTLTYGNSAPDNPQIRWEVAYNESTKLSSIKSADGDYIDYNAATGKLSWSSEQKFIWKLLRSSNDAYATGYRINYNNDGKTWIHMEHTNGQIECDGSVQGTWGTPHWEVSAIDVNAQPSMVDATIDTSKWYRLENAFPGSQYFYQTSGGYSYGAASEKDARSHWQFIKDGNYYILYNRNFDMYVGTYGNGALKKEEDKSEAVRFGVKQYVADGSYVIYEKNDKEYLSQYLNIRGRNGSMKLTMESVDFKETRWILEEAVNDIETSADVVVNTYLPTNKESGVYKLNNTTGLTVEHYSTYVRVSNNDGQYLALNKNGNAVWKNFTHDYDKQFYFSYVVYGDNMLLTQGNTTLFLEQVASDREFKIAEGSKIANAYTFSIYAAEAKEYTVLLNTVDNEDKLGIRNTVSINGTTVMFGDKTNYTSGEVDQFKVTLQQGNNLLRFSRGDTLDSIVVCGIISNGYQGATLGLTEYEFENGNQSANAIIEEGSRDRFSMLAEASGRSYVSLNAAGDWAEIKLLNPANAFTLRYSVPDAPTGGGAEFTLTMKAGNAANVKINLTSEYGHAYKSWYYTNQPSGGSEHVWFDEVTYRFDNILPAGTVIRFTKNFDDEADYYALDMLETEIVSAKIAQPANSISIVEKGAVSTDKADLVQAAKNLQALKDAVDEAAATGKEVYIPEGTFYMGVENTKANVVDSDGSTHSTRPYSDALYNITKGVTIRGAGVWYSTVYGLEYQVSTDNLALYSTKYMGYCDTRNDYQEHAFVDNGGARQGLVLANLWVDHYKAGFWLANKKNTIVSGNRVRYMYADGLNFQNNADYDYVVNNNFRSTGDDGIAAWSQSENKNITVAYNTVENPWHANAIAFYGGTNITIINNICKDTAYRGAGVNLSTDFTPTPFMGFVKVENNLFLRCGGDNVDDGGKDVGAIWFNMLSGKDATAVITVKGNVILDSTHQGVSFEKDSKLHNLTLESNVILNSGSYGIEIPSDFKGNMLLKNNAIAGSGVEDIINGARGESRVEMVNYVIEIEAAPATGGSGATSIALWVVSGVLLAGAVALGVLLTLTLVKKKKED